MFVIKFFYFIIFIIIINCSGNKVSNYHGVKLLDAKFDEIKLNITNKNDLYKIIGPPSFKSEFNENKWFYVERKLTNQSLFKFGVKKISKNNILVIELNNKGLVENKKMLRKNDMNNIKYVKKITQKDFEQDNTIYNIFSSLREKVNAPSRNKFKKD